MNTRAQKPSDTLSLAVAFKKKRFVFAKKSGRADVDRHTPITRLRDLSTGSHTAEVVEKPVNARKRESADSREGITPYNTTSCESFIILFQILPLWVGMANDDIFPWKTWTPHPAIIVNSPKPRSTPTVKYT